LRDPIRIFLGGKALGFGCFNDFVAVFVGSGKEEDLFAFEALEPGYYIRYHRGIGVS